MPMKVELPVASAEHVVAGSSAADPLLSRLEEFFSSPEFTSAIGQFMGTHLAGVVLVDSEGEQPLENYNVFRLYNELLEAKLQEFLEKEGLNPEDLYNRCREAKAAGEVGWAMCLDYLLACTEYDAFLQLVADFKGMSTWEEEGGGSGDALEWDYSDSAEEEAGGADAVAGASAEREGRMQ